MFEGRGLLDAAQPGLTVASFKPVEALHAGAHGSFSAFMTCIGLANHPEMLPAPDKYIEHLGKYCKYLDYMHQMFKGGKAKQDVLVGVINLHRPASYWQALETAFSNTRRGARDARRAAQGGELIALKWGVDAAEVHTGDAN